MEKIKEIIKKPSSKAIIIFIAIIFVIGILYNNANNKQKEQQAIAKAQQQAAEQKAKDEAEAKQKKLDSYTQLLDSGKIYDNFTYDEKDIFSDLIKNWNSQKDDFKSKYKEQKDKLTKEQADSLAKWKAQYDAEQAKKEQLENNTPKTVTSNYKAKFGQILEANQLNNKLTIKFKISPSATNKLTIDQNGFNVEDLITNQGADKYDSISYWAVADMTDGSESKVIAYTLNKDLIQKIKDKKVFGQQIANIADDVWILPSLKK